jgi:hypothetical protein
MFWMHGSLRKVPALEFDPRLQEFVETVYGNWYSACVSCQWTAPASG